MYKIFTIITTIFLGVLPVSSKSYGWGFKKNNENIQPYIGIYEQEIENTNSYYVGDSNEKKVYLTFDAGYDNGNLIKILDVLDEKEVTGCFFITGDFLNRFSDLVIEIKKRNHLVGNHTWSHKNITLLNKEQINKELYEVENKFYELTNKKIDPFFRPPAGVFNKKSLEVIKSNNYYTIFWSVAYKDWDVNNQNNHEMAINSVISNLHNGAIILLHTVSSDNVLALPIIIDKIREEGYEICSLYDLIINDDYLLKY